MPEDIARNPAAWIDRSVLRLGRPGAVAVLAAVAVVISTLLCAAAYLLAWPEAWSVPAALILPVVTPAVTAPPILWFLTGAVERARRAEEMTRERERELILEVAERARAEAAADEARRQADAANLSKTRFLANLSHEVRNQLNSIVGFTELMANDRLPLATYSEYSGYVHESARHLLALLSDVLDLAKIEHGRIDLRPVARPARQALESVLPLAEAEGRLRGISVAVECHPHCPAVHADERAFAQMMANLVANAVRHSMPGGRILLGAEPDGKGGAVVSVTDAGPGIREADRLRLLQPFEQGDPAAIAAVGGSGLGLSIVQALAELHGGRLSLDDAAGGGLRACLRLPGAGAAKAG